jgi:hypothetical protein
MAASDGGHWHLRSRRGIPAAAFFMQEFCAMPSRAGVAVPDRARSADGVEANGAEHAAG